MVVLGAELRGQCSPAVRIELLHPSLARARLPQIVDASVPKLDDLVELTWPPKDVGERDPQRLSSCEKCRARWPVVEGQVPLGGLELETLAEPRFVADSEQVEEFDHRPLDDHAPLRALHLSSGGRGVLRR